MITFRICKKRIYFLIFLIIVGCGKKKEIEEERIEVARRGKFVVKIRESGNLEPLISVDIRSNVEGEIDQLFVDEGDFVEKNQDLLKIDPEQIEQQKRQAEASRDARKATVDQANLRIYLTEKQQKSAIAQSENSVEISQATLESHDATSKQQLSQAEADLATTENLLEQDRIALNQAEIALQQAKMTLDQYRSNESSAKISLNNAKSELDRTRELYEKKYVPKKSLENAEDRFASAKSQHASAKKNVESQLKSIESQKQNIEARKRAIENRETTLKLLRQNLNSITESQNARRKQLLADLENAKTRLQQALETTDQEKELTVHSETSAKAGLLEAESQLKWQEERLDWTTVIAPISGRITKLSIEEGEIITSGRSAFSQGPAILTIADLSKMVVKTYINEVDIAKIKLGQKVEIRIDAYRDKVFNGIISEIAPSADAQRLASNGIVTFEVITEVIGSPPELLPGMSADIDIIVFEAENILQLPIEAVIISDTLTVKADLSDTDVNKIKTDQKVKIENLIGKQFDATIGKILSNDVEILLDGTPRGVRTGPAEVKIIISETDQIDGVQAEIESEKKHFAQIDDGSEPPEKSKKAKGKDGKIPMRGQRKRIEIAQRNSSHFEIVSGLDVGDRVFVPSMKQITEIKNESEK